MRYKIMMMVLLCALLVGLVPPGSARAETLETTHVYETNVVTFDKETFTFSCSDGSWLRPSSAMLSRLASGYNWALFPASDGKTLWLFAVEEPYGVAVGVKDVYVYSPYQIGKVWTSEVQVFAESYSVSTTGISIKSECNLKSMNGSYSYYGLSSSGAVYFNRGGACWADHVVKSVRYATAYGSDKSDYHILEYAFYYPDSYTLLDYFSAVGLSSGVSSNELEGVKAFSYSPARKYIVSKGNVGQYDYILTVIYGYTDSLLYQYSHVVDGGEKIGVMHLFDDSIKVTVYRYGYDFEGGGWKLYDSSVYEDVKFNTPVTDIEVMEGGRIVYTNQPIFSSTMNEVVYERTLDKPTLTPTPTPTPIPSNPGGGSGVQEQVLYLYPSDFQGTIVTSSASIYDVTNGSDDDILVDILKGMCVDVHGWTVDGSGSTWYYCTYTNIYNGEVTGEFTGFIRGDSVGITNGAGGTEEEQNITLAEQLQIAASFVLSVPLIIGSIFSFLPPWCLTFLGLAFSVTALLMVLRK